MLVTLAVTPPSSENDIPVGGYECPADSIFTGGICKCNPGYCTKPPCLTTLTVVKNATETPGQCCPVYSCDGCSTNALINGKCPCATNAILSDSGNTCECINLYESLSENNTCICNPSKCELPRLCDGKSVTAKELDGCCYRTKCIPCPHDSFPTSHKSDQVEDKCVCYKCNELECASSTTPVIIRRGKGVPGMCCDLYECKSVQNKSCVVGNSTYLEGETWASPEGMCKCQRGISVCSQSNNVISSQKPCFTEDKVYHHRESWIEDSCTNCTCIDGNHKCIAHMCEVDERQVKKPDCPTLFNCTKKCVNGFKTDKKGCELCKCSKGNALEEILTQYNLTKDELIKILNDNLTKKSVVTTSSSTSTTPSTTVYITDKTCENQELATPWYCIPLIIVVVTLSAGCLAAVGMCLFCNKKKEVTSYPMVSPYSYSPVKAKLENNNNAHIYSTINENNGPEKIRLA